MPGIKLIYVTARDVDEAKAIGKAMVEQRLAACANVLPGMQSMYVWEGDICEDNEAVLLLKTMEEQVDALTQAVRSAHSYECPCVLVLPVEGGNEAYLDWVRAQLGGQDV